MNYKICNRCVMDTSVENINFDNNGFCNYCSKFIEKLNNLKKNNSNIYELKKKIQIKKKGKEYDCIIGLSGGVDSCFTLHKAIEIGLKPLVVHMDNGWNSELAQSNIENLVKSLNLDLYTHVIDWNEYKNMMNSFFKADVIDVELLMDNAMLAVNYQQASKHKINYILGGTNITSEGMEMPSNMNWFKYDKKNILNIIDIFGKNKISTYPIIGTLDLVHFISIKKIKWISFLDFFDYNKFEAIELLKKKYNFKPYPYKHYESIFTRFYQGYLLPKKFGVDKRKLHLSTLVISKQISRDEAISELASDHAYPNEEMLENDKLYFLKKMEWSHDDLKEYINRPKIPHDYYKSEKKVYNFFLKSYKFLKFLKF